MRIIITLAVIATGITRLGISDGVMCVCYAQWARRGCATSICVLVWHVQAWRVMYTRYANMDTCYHGYVCARRGTWLAMVMSLVPPYVGDDGLLR